jgi:hypothetical protein
MTIRAPGVVRISKPVDQSFAEAMGRMRDWLDQRKIQPVLFRQIAYEAGIEGFEVRFASETEAQLFNEAFG